jgi:hypothetical protein
MAWLLLVVVVVMVVWVFESVAPAASDPVLGFPSAILVEFDVLLVLASFSFVACSVLLASAPLPLPVPAFPRLVGEEEAACEDAVTPGSLAFPLSAEP